MTALQNGLRHFESSAMPSDQLESPLLTVPQVSGHMPSALHTSSTLYTAILSLAPGLEPGLDLVQLHVRPLLRCQLL